MISHIRRVAAAFAAAAAVLAVSASAFAATTNGDPIDRVRQALGDRFAVRETELGNGWERVQLARSDEPFPVKVDVLASTDQAPSRVAYLLPGGGASFKANFFTPRANNLAHFLRRRGYLVVGVTPREDSLPPLSNDPVAGGWDLAAHRQDLVGITQPVNGALGMPHDVAGHSAGALLALSYAGHRPPGLGRVMVLDTTGPFHPVTEAALRQRADETHQTLEGLLPTQRTLDAGNALKVLLRNAIENPNGDSGQPRPPGGTFTNAGLLHFSLINTGVIPSLFQWIYEPSLNAGTYTFGPLPTQDTFSFRHVTVPLLSEAAGKLGSGMLPTALLSDLFAVWAGEAGLINWAGIKARVAWVNMALGRGDHRHGAELISGAGNPNVRFTVIPSYGHADAVWGRNAALDVWPLLLNP